MPPNDFAFENQPKNTIETTYSSQFGNFLDYQNERDSDYLVFLPLSSRWVGREHAALQQQRQPLGLDVSSSHRLS